MIKPLLAAALALALSAAPAQAEPACNASGLMTATGQVASGTATWLNAHPGAQDAIDSANDGTIRDYFLGHQQEWKELQGIAAPLKALRTSCPQQVSPQDVARLFDAMAS
jgi:hemophore-related protein